MKKYLYPFLIIVALGCKGDAELSMERGIKYFEWGQYNDAILEFNEAKLRLAISDWSKSFEYI